MLATRIKRIVFLFISCLILCHISQAQFQFQNSDEWERVKTDTAYVLLNNVASSKNDPVKELFNTYWKISPVRYLEASDFENHLSPDALYFSLVYRTETSFSASPQEGYYNSSGWHTVGPLSTGGSSSLTINLNWQLWTFKFECKGFRFKFQYAHILCAFLFFLFGRQ